MRASTAVGALFIVLRYWNARRKAQRAKTKPERFYVSDLSTIGHQVVGKGQYDADEFDVIIVGGGECVCGAPALSPCCMPMRMLIPSQVLGAAFSRLAYPKIPPSECCC